MIIKAFIYHKRAEKYCDCQDCFGIDTQNNRIAISDGMSQSIFPQWWAEILVDNYLKNGHVPDPEAENIHSLQMKWQKKLRDEINRREEEAITNPKRDPWRLKNLMAERSGAGATLCGLTLAKDKWTCECLGDSCVISINNDYTIDFYTSQVGEFGNHPDYFDSFGNGRGKTIRKPLNQNVKALLMVTDPFAELFQKYKDEKSFIKSRFNEIQNLTDHESFSKLVEKWRDDFEMHNDDSTLIIIEEVHNIGFQLKHRDKLTDLCEKEVNQNKVYSSTSQSKSLSETNVHSHISPQPETKYQEEFEQTKKQAQEAIEALLSFSPENKRVNVRALYKWLLKHLMPTIKKYLKKK